ncbi:hypothetical protein LTR17_024455 [Elasticomyces elasticus]|nr:hypothetical protein LTR17_024455 [Elasticomyces elasticus]
MKSAHRRDKLIKDDRVIGFEMERPGAWEILPTIVVKCVVDYAVSHKNKQWREYPAAQAALCAAAVVEEIDLPDRPHILTLTFATKLWAVLWMDCSSNTTACGDFKRISSQYQWPVAEDSIVDDGRDRLARLTAPALLVLDNCDDESVDYGAYIPDNLLVTVVMTTRLREAKSYASRDTQDPSKEHVIRLDGLQPASAIRLLMKVSDTQNRRPGDDEAARKIVEANGIFSIQEYATVLEGRLIEGDALDQRNNATFEVSAQALAASSDPSAEHALALLGLLPFMHYQQISEEIFVRAWAYEEMVLTDCGDQDKHEETTIGGEGEAEEPPKKKPRMQASNEIVNEAIEKMPQGKPVNLDKPPQKAPSKEKLGIDHLSQWHVTKCRNFLGSQPLEQRKRAFRRARAHLTQLSLVTLSPGMDNPDTKLISSHSLIVAWAKQRNLQHYESWVSAAVS